MRALLILVIISLTTACSTIQPSGPVSENTLYTLKKTGILASQEGVLVMSAGRVIDPCKECNANWAGILPFVSYHLMHEYEKGKYKEVAFIPAEAGLFSQIGKEHYGFIHMRELPGGRYIMLGNHSRGRSVMLAAGGVFLMLDDGNNETGIAYEFSVQPGKINYLGEFITENGVLENSSISIRKNEKRDLDFMYKKYPQLKSYAVVQPKIKDKKKRVF
ncbi:hypothetical protein [Spongorhabdus nitratireducens]